MNTDNSPPPPFLTAADIAELWSAERQDEENVKARAEGRAPRVLAPISPKTVWAYHQWSMPPRSAAKRGVRNRYEDNPMPLATYLDPQRPVWLPAEGRSLAELRAELVSWWHSRKGAGVGGGAGAHVRNQRGNEWEIRAAARDLTGPQRTAILSDSFGDGITGGEQTLRSLVRRGLAVWARRDPDGAARLTTNGRAVRDLLLSRQSAGAS